MEQQRKITSLQELIDWINNDNDCHVSETDNEYFYIEAPNNADVFVCIEKDADIDDIVLQTIDNLEDFDANERFMELWSKEFAEHNHFTPSHFIKILQEDKETFCGVAYRLRDFVGKKEV